MKNLKAPRGVPTTDPAQMALLRSLTVERFGVSAQPDLDSDAKAVAATAQALETLAASPSAPACSSDHESWPPLPVDTHAAFSSGGCRSMCPAAGAAPRGR